MNLSKSKVFNTLKLPYVDWCGGKESNLPRSLLAGYTNSCSRSLAWVGISTRLRRNAIPHQTLATKQKRANELFIITSIVVETTAITEMKMSNPNEIATLTSMCTCTSKPVKLR